MHTPVLLKEVLSLFGEGKPIARFLDCTLGLGGHATALLKQHSEIAHYLGCDQDPAALNLATQALSPWKEKLQLFPYNFADLKTLSLPLFDGILADLGVSSLQLDSQERGFSFRFDAPLDMRMNPENPLTAAAIVNSWEERELGRLFRDLGEEPKWRTVARTIVQARKKAPLETTQQLLDLLMPLFPPHLRQKKIHPLTLIFQALRLAVNRELEALETLLAWAIHQLAPGGRLAIITFHSLEDRLVKRAFQYAASDKEDTSGRGGVFLDKAPTVKILTRHALACSEEEALSNPRARSAKLRAVEKLP